MLSDGVYKVAYFDHEQPEAALEPMLLILRDGSLMGSDPLGGVYFAEVRTGLDGAATVRGVGDIPPDGELVTGYVAGADGASVSLSVNIGADALRRRQTVIVGDRPVDVEISYLGPLPE